MGWLLGDTHGIAEASPRLSAPSPLPALDRGSLHLAGHHRFAPPAWRRARSSAARGRRTGWAVREGCSSSARRFPVCKLSLQGPACRACGQHCRGTGDIGRWAPPGHQPLATSPWPAGPRAEGMESPGVGLSASHVGRPGGCRGAMGGEGFPPQLAAPSKRVETSGWRGLHSQQLHDSSSSISEASCCSLGPQKQLFPNLGSPGLQQPPIPTSHGGFGSPRPTAHGLGLHCAGQQQEGCSPLLPPFRAQTLQADPSDPLGPGPPHPVSPRK